MMQISLKAARVNANLKQEDAAEAVGVTKSTIISWEKGRTYPDGDKLMELCDLYKVPISAIFLR